MSVSVKRTNEIAFQPLANFTSKRPRAGSAAPATTQISFSTFTRGNSADQATIANLADRPALSSFHADITPDNKIEDPSVSPIIISFPVEMDKKVIGIGQNGFIPKGVIITAKYAHSQFAIDSMTHKRGPFKGLHVRPYKREPLNADETNEDVVAVVTAESCRGPDAATNNVCVISGAIADTTELNMEHAPQNYKTGDIVYAMRSSAQDNKDQAGFVSNKHFLFHSGVSFDNVMQSVLKFMIVHPQRGKANALVTILPIMRYTEDDDLLLASGFAQRRKLGKSKKSSK